MAQTSFAKELLDLTIKEQASDLHISVGHPPILRVSGRLVPLVKKPVVSAQDAEDFAFSLLSPEQKDAFLAEKEIDFSYQLEEKGRFRINVFRQRGNVGCALRLIPPKIQSIADLNLPPVLSEFTKSSQGFVLVTGPSGHGKSTTLAALIEEINHTR